MTRLIALVVLALATLLPSMAYSATVSVVLRPQSEIAHSRDLTVADIAEVRGAQPLAGKIAGVPLGSGLTPGQTRKLDTAYIRAVLRSRGLAESAALSGAPVAVVTARCAGFGAEQLSAEAERYLRGLLPASRAVYEVVLQRGPRALTVPAESAVIRCRLLGSSARLGSNTVALDAVVAGNVAATTSATFEVRAAARVLVARDTIRQGAPLNAENTVWELRDITRLRDIITDEDTELDSGLVARRTISPGTAITSMDVAQPLCIRSGDAVSVSVRGGAVMVRVNGEARQDGRIGDTIRVHSPISREDIRARITGPGTAEITL